MRVLCLNPPFKSEYGRFSRSSRSPAITKGGTLYYPIWLCYVVGVLEKVGHQVRLIDSCAYGYGLEKTLEITREFHPQIAILDTSTPSIYNDVRVGAAIKQLLPECFVVLMGTHPTALPEETLRLDGAIDAIAVGEAEYTLRELAAKLSDGNLVKTQRDRTYRNQILSSIDGLAYRARERLYLNKRRGFIENLDGLPFVSQVYKRHLGIKKYFFGASDYPEVQIMTARGCVARCSFCVYPQTVHGFKYRMRSAQNVADEFEWIEKNIPEAREIGIEDDTFTGHQERAIEFCRELIKRKIKIKWYCNVRADLKYETMKWMKNAGCVLVTVGYESANLKILKNIDKRITPEMILEFSRNARKAKLLVHGCFMAGNRGETAETLKESLKLSLKLMDDSMQFFPLMVYPGTIAYRQAKEEGHLETEDFSRWVTEDGLHNCILDLPNLSAKELLDFCDTARKRYYLRPKYLLYKIGSVIRNPQEVRRILKVVNKFWKYLLKGTFGQSKGRKICI